MFEQCMQLAGVAPGSHTMAISTGVATQGHDSHGQVFLYKPRTGASMLSGGTSRLANACTALLSIYVLAARVESLRCC